MKLIGTILYTNISWNLAVSDGLQNRPERDLQLEPGRVGLAIGHQKLESIIDDDRHLRLEYKGSQSDTNQGFNFKQTPILYEE